MILSIDVGLKRIGIATHIENITLPLEPIIRKNRNQAAKELKELIESRNVKKLIVGIPIGGSSEDEMRRRIEHFVSLLDFKGEIFYQDESFSSHEAEEMAKEGSRDRRDGKRDSLAAKIILERWLCNKLKVK